MGKSKPLACALLLLATFLLFAGRAVADNPPMTAYIEPHPHAAAGSVAQTFVHRVAPSLASVSSAQLQRGLVPAAPGTKPRVASPQAGSGRKTTTGGAQLQTGVIPAAPGTKPRVASPSAGNGGRGTVSPAVERRAGVGTASGGLGTKPLLVAAAVLAFAGVVVWAVPTSRRRARWRR